MLTTGLKTWKSHAIDEKEKLGISQRNILILRICVKTFSSVLGPAGRFASSVLVLLCSVQYLDQLGVLLVSVRTRLECRIAVILHFQTAEWILAAARHHKQLLKSIALPASVVLSPSSAICHVNMLN